MNPEQKNISCALCHAYLFEEDDVVYCPVCGAPHHRECYNSIGHCALEQLHGTEQQYDKIKRKKLKLPKDKKVNEVYTMAKNMLLSEGYIRYEVSNFARPGFKSRHNMKYWTEVDYLGLGVSAHSYIDGYRYFNTKCSLNSIFCCNIGFKLL